MPRTPWSFPWQTFSHATRHCLPLALVSLVSSSVIHLVYGLLWQFQRPHGIDKLAAEVGAHEFCSASRIQQEGLPLCKV